MSLKYAALAAGSFYDVTDGKFQKTERIQKREQLGEPQKQRENV